MKQLLVNSQGHGVQNSVRNLGFQGGGLTTANQSVSLPVFEPTMFSRVTMNATTGGSGDNTITITKNNTTTVLAATVTGSGIAINRSDTITGISGDYFCFQYSDTGTDSTVATMTCLMEALGRDRQVSVLGCYSGTATVFDVPSTTQFVPLWGNTAVDGTATEANAQHKIYGVNRWDSMQVFVNANARVDNSTFKNRINTADGTGSITVAAAQTGRFTHTHFNDALKDGDLVNLSITFPDAGVEDLSMACMQGAFLSRTNQSNCIIGANYTGLARAASATQHYVPIGGVLSSFTAYATEAAAAVSVGFPWEASNLRCYVLANTYGADATLKLFKNGVAALTTTITAGGANTHYVNATDSISGGPDDTISFEVTGGTSGSATFGHLAVTLKDITHNPDTHPFTRTRF